MLTPSPPELVPQGLTATVKVWLAELGYAEGTDVRYELRFSAGGDEHLPGLAADLVALNVDLILAYGVPAARAARSASDRIPVLTCIQSDPMRVGLIDDRGPGITIVTTWSLHQVRRRVELLKEALPQLKRLAVLANPTDRDGRAEVEETEAAARGLGLQVDTVSATRPSDLDAAVARSSRNEAVLVLADRHLGAAAEQLTRLLLGARLPAMYSDGFFVDGRRFESGIGGLIAYGPTSNDVAQELALQIDRILKAGRPGPPRVVRSTKYELVVNVRTARALGLTLPPALLRRADLTLD